MIFPKIEKNTNDIIDMLPKEYENTIALFDGISNNDLDTIIIYLQYVRARRKREFDSKQVFGICDHCIRVYPITYGECKICEKTLRTLPIRCDYSYLLDGEPIDNNKSWKEI